MTGFASKTTTLSFPDKTKVNASVNLKSLNSRFFEATCKLPHIVTHLETNLIKRLKKNLHRGHIYLTIHIKNEMITKEGIKPNFTMVKGYLEAINKIQKTFSIKGDITLSETIKFPGIFEIEEQELNKSIDKQILEIVDNLIKQLIIARQKEGVLLKKDIKKQITAMRKEIVEIEKKSKKLITEKKQEIAEIIKKIDNEEQEVADNKKSNLLFMLDKLDINEEIVRFKSHLENLSNHIDSEKDELGKKLDFTLQEMAREINTISAKCSDATISAKAIDIKVEIEKAREQAQNIV